ncbi:MAG TPA: DUF1957 domain-containing protein [Polyangiaceae bacterium]|nr:DUF1957 domain-containing protein [Polyangiaceae bacterium]
MAKGYLALVLHAHLPFVRHPEHERHLEERWLYEALLECYLPIVEALDRLRDEGVPYALTMSLTPPLAAMLGDELLRGRFAAHLKRLEALAEQEAARVGDDARFAPIVAFYRAQLASARVVWERHGGRVIDALVSHWDSGGLELLACSATHAYLPGMLAAPEGIRPQLELGMRGFEALTGRRPTGAWLAECAYHPDLDAELARAGVKYTLLDSHGVENASPRPPFGVHAPILSPGGTAFFGRDPESSRVVWSRSEGYPGDVYYRDFYRDIGFDLDESELSGEVGPFGARVMTGLKYYRITGATDHKEPYMPGEARARAWEHAGDFVRGRRAQVERLCASGASAGTPVVVAPYDAELFGHWWFEGPWFLEAVFRRLAEEERACQGVLEATTLGHYLAREPTCAEATPCASSWGAGGYGEVWVGPEAAWTWRHVHHATRWVKDLVVQHREVGGHRGQALDQLIRELLLLQSSDWNFILRTATSIGYAEARLRAHTHRLRHLAYLLEKPHLDAEDLAFIADVVARDNLLAPLTSSQLRSVF